MENRDQQKDGETVELRKKDYKAILTWNKLKDELRKAEEEEVTAEHLLATVFGCFRGLGRDLDIPKQLTEREILKYTILGVWAERCANKEIPPVELLKKCVALVGLTEEVNRIIGLEDFLLTDDEK